jgi:hypothetical protein
LAVARGLFVGLLAGVLSSSWAGDVRAQRGTSWGGAEVSAGGFVWRPTGDRSPAWHDGLELTWGPTLTYRQRPWRFTGLVQIDLRAFATTSWALGLSTNSFEVAAALGPIEPFVRVGAALLTVDDFDGSVSAELFSPRVTTGLDVRLGRNVEVGVGAYAEYFWRWLGPSAVVRGLSLDLRFERRMRPRRRQ